tara:strand:+ start:31220 stop:31738 length:519 start_codon:yes stop_codon:yes gene_type:complete
MSYNNVKHHKLGRFYIVVERSFDHIISVLPNFLEDNPEIPTQSEMFYIKPGVTSQKETANSGVLKRLSSNQTGNPRQLEYIYVSEPFEYFNQYETKVQKHLKNCHVRGEWYWVNSYELMDLMDMVHEDTEILADVEYFHNCMGTLSEVREGILAEEYTPSQSQFGEFFEETV